MLRKNLTAILLSGLLQLVALPTLADEQPTRVKVISAYIDVYSGPGRGYPQFYVAERGEWIEILERKTDWFKVRLESKKEGWVYRDQLEETLSVSGEKVKLRDATFEDYYESRWEIGLMYGDFGGANSLSITSAFGFTYNISAEINISQISGDFSDGYKAHVNIFHEGFPDWWISPYFLLGAGIIHTDPKATLVATENRDDQLVTVGGGARIYFTRKFILRAEYKSFVILTEREQNEEVEQWTLGFSVFF